MSLPAAWRGARAFSRPAGIILIMEWRPGERGMPGVTLAFEGWRVVAGAFLVNMVGFGAIYSYAAFADDLAAAFGASSVTTSMALALSGASCFAVCGVSGPLADRIGPRPLALAGMMLVALGLLGAALAQGMVQVLVCYGALIGLGTGFAYAPAMAAVQRWFIAWRGFASGVAAAGIGLGTALVPPMTNLLAAHGDWRFAFLTCAVGAGLVGGLGALLLSAGAPEALGQRPDGGHAAPARPSHASGPAAAGLVRDGGFTRMWLGTLLLSIPVSLPFGSLVGSARTLGIGAGDALGLLGVVGIGSVGGRFLLGALGDLLGRRVVFLACSTGLVAATTIWSLSTAHLALTSFAFLFGFAYGGFVALLPAFAADCFGRRSAGTAIGLLYTGRAIALLVGPPALTAAIGITGGHTLPVAAAALVGLLGVVLLAGTTRQSER